MPREAFLWALGIATVVLGVVVLVMAALRARRRKAAFRRRARLTPVVRLAPRPRPVRAIELADEDLEPLDEPEVPVAAPTKICPACGSRYASGYRVCTRDDNDLAALN